MADLLQVGSDSIEVVDPGAVDAFVRIRVLEVNAPTIEAPAYAGARACVRALLQTTPELAALLANSGRLVVEFSPATQQALRAGTLNLMESSGRGLAVAVDHAGRIVEQGRVVKLGVMAVLVPAAPALLMGMAANAMAAAQMNRIERVLNEVNQTVGRIEARSRDDDLGKIRAAMSLIALMQGSIARQQVGQQLRIELAVAASNIDSLFFARWHTSQRLLSLLEARSGAWNDELKRMLNDKVPASAELQLFLAATVARSGLASARAACLALDGDAEAAIDLQSTVHRELEVPYRQVLDAIDPFTSTSLGCRRLREFNDVKRRSAEFSRFAAVVEQADQIESVVIPPAKTIQFELEASDLGILP